DARAVDDRVTVVELAVQLAERGDLGRAHEGEVLRPEENDLPLAGLVLVGEVLERGVEVVRDDALQVQFRKLVTNCQPCAYLYLVRCTRRPFRRDVRMLPRGH